MKWASDVRLKKYRNPQHMDVGLAVIKVVDFQISMHAEEDIDPSLIWTLLELRNMER